MRYTRGLMDDKIRDQLLAKLSDLPTLPLVLRRVLQIIGDSRSSAGDVAEAIRVDQALSARLLRIINSAYYGLTHKVSGVRHAVVMLGYRSVANIVMSVSVFDSLVQASDGAGLDKALFWQHSLATAACASRLAKQTRLHDPEEAYTAGLLHDMGKLVLARFQPEGYAKVLQALMEGGQVIEQEKLLLGASHDEVGGLVAARWNFPSHLRDAISFHHATELGWIEKAETRNLTALIAVADYLCWEMGFPSADAAAMPLLAPEVLELVDFSGLDRDELSDHVESEIQRAAEIYEMQPLLPKELRARMAADDDYESVYDQIRAGLEERAVDTSVIGSILQSVQGCATADEVFAILMEKIRDAFQFDRIFLFRKDTEADPAVGLQLSLLLDERGMHSLQDKAPVLDGPIADCAEKRQAFVHRGSIKFPGSDRASDSVCELGGVPVVVADHLLAVLVVSNEQSGTPVTDQAIRSMDLLAREVSLVIENQQLSERFQKTDRLARTDELTGLPNRRQCLTVLAQEMEISRSTPAALSVAMFDLDHFKEHNDQFGHAVGDQILTQVGQVLLRSTRGQDTCGRLGGDEFFVILPAAEREQALGMCERARELVTEISSGYATKSGASLSLSAGVATFDPEEDDGASLMARADRALYKAKAAGRNQVC